MIKKTAILLVGVALVLSVLTSGCSFNVGETSPSPTATTYTSVKGYSIAYTSDWGKPEEQNNATLVVFLTPANNKSESLNVQAYETDETLSELTDSMLSEVEEFTNFKLIESGNTTLAGNPAYKIVYTATLSSGYNQKITQIWTIKDGKEIIITYKGAPANYDTYLSAAQKMIDSLQIK